VATTGAADVASREDCGGGGDGDQRCRSDVASRELGDGDGNDPAGGDAASLSDDSLTSSAS
jgi:hypothetical protein